MLQEPQVGARREADPVILDGTTDAAPRRHPRVHRPGRGRQDHPRRRRPRGRLLPGDPLPLLPRQAGPRRGRSSPARRPASSASSHAAAAGAESLEDAVVAIVLRASTGSADQPALQFVLIVEPEVLLPHLAFHGADRVLARRRPRRRTGAGALRRRGRRRARRRMARAHRPLVRLQPDPTGRPRRPALRPPTGRRIRLARPRFRLCISPGR